MEQDAIQKLLYDRITDNGDVIGNFTQLQGLYKELGAVILHYSLNSFACYSVFGQ